MPWEEGGSLMRSRRYSGGGRGPSFVDLFSGAGGSALGFILAGFRLVGALDSYRPAVDTFEYNLGFRPIEADATSFDFSSWAHDLGDVDVVVGCPPCQGFSRMGNPQLSTDGGDPRNRLVYVFLRAVEAIRPKAVVFENVSWMAKAYHGKYLLELMQRLRKLKYTVDWRILDAANYGVPQHRRRLILIALLGERPVFPEPTHGRPGSKEVLEGIRLPWKTVRDAIWDLPSIGPGETHPSVPNHVTRKLPENWLRLIRAVPKDGGSRRQAPKELWLPCHRRHNGHNDVFGRLWWDRPSNTITTGCWDPSRGRFVHPEQDRGLSLRECARLQSFPDDFVFTGSLSSVAKQIGNALPPKLAQKVAESLRPLI